MVNTIFNPLMGSIIFLGFLI